MVEEGRTGQGRISSQDVHGLQRGMLWLLHSVTNDGLVLHWKRKHGFVVRAWGCNSLNSILDSVTDFLGELVFSSYCASVPYLLIEGNDASFVNSNSQIVVRYLERAHK